MKSNKGPKGPEDLRKRAEESLKSEPHRPGDTSLEEAASLIHELRVHQIELEMQNEELRRVQNDLEISRSRYADLYDFAPVGYLTLNEHGQIVALNLTAARQLGIERGRLVNKHFQYSVFQPDKKEFLSHLNAIFDKRERQIAEVRLSPKGGEQFYARIESIYMEGEDGAGLCRTNISDVTLRKKRNRSCGTPMMNWSAAWMSAPVNSQRPMSF
ncbi:MAG: PAS domain-containing protein [Syntrophobacteraceae bacterium]